jgi:hypothetical protein
MANSRFKIKDVVLTRLTKHELCQESLSTKINKKQSVAGNKSNQEVTYLALNVLLNAVFATTAY